MSLISAVIAIQAVLFAGISTTASTTLVYERSAQLVSEQSAKEKSISELIIEYAKKNHADSELALNVACAESCTRNADGEIIINPNAKNPNSTASGVFQFISSTWKSLCSGNVFDPHANIDCGTKLLASAGGISHWNASKNEGFGGGWQRKPYSTYNVVN